MLVMLFSSNKISSLWNRICAQSENASDMFLHLDYEECKTSIQQTAI